MGVNYGLNKVRFPAPLPVGARVRLTAEIAAVDPVPGGVQLVAQRHRRRRRRAANPAAWPRRSAGSTRRRSS